ncbi:lysM and putative peptidoglycan-binding domain-containing protein 1 [Genypterus blacodes]|uniref:lysM and putative peptidoglycan-binding domain-containing protein 1 n=1 Tax=Genypterus blacodes TaxID=154954 RepID=UPI003F760084
MSGERSSTAAAAAAAGGGSLLRGSRTRSYGSLVRSPVSPARLRTVEHRVLPGDTLQGLALTYGVTMEQIKRANRMYTNDSIFLKTSLLIPVLSDSSRGRGASAPDDSEEDSSCVCSPNGNAATEATRRASDLSPVDFLKRMDGLISLSKQAAAKGCQDAERRVAALEAACASGTTDRRRLTRSHSAAASSVPLTATKLTMTLRDGEDDIFEL